MTVIRLEQERLPNLKGFNWVNDKMQHHKRPNGELTKDIDLSSKHTPLAKLVENTSHAIIHPMSECQFIDMLGGYDESYCNERYNNSKIDMYTLDVVVNTVVIDNVNSLDEVRQLVQAMKDNRFMHSKGIFQLSLSISRLVVFTRNLQSDVHSLFDEAYALE